MIILNQENNDFIDDAIDEDVSAELLAPSDEEIIERERGLTSYFYRIFGIVLISLSTIILILVTISFFFHAGQPDETALFIEQIIGFSLAGFSIILGSAFLLYSIKKKNESLAIVEPIDDEVNVNHYED